MPKFREVTEGSKQRFVATNCVLAAPRTVIEGLTEVGNEEKQLPNSEKRNVIFNNFSSEYFSGFASFPTLVKPTLTVCCTVRTASPTYSSSTINLRFILPSPHKVWVWSFPALSIRGISLQHNILSVT